MKKLIPIALLLSTLILANSASALTVYFVRWGGAGLQDGSSWANAFDQPQDAITAINPSVEAADEQFWVIMEATDPGQVYDKAYYSGSIQRGLTVVWLGGYDTNTVVVGRSAIGNDPANPALGFRKTTGDHNEVLKQSGFNLVLTNCTVGLLNQVIPAYTGVKPVASLVNSITYASTYGIHNDYAVMNVVGHGPTQSDATDCTFYGGTDGIYAIGPQIKVAVETSSFYNQSNNGINAVDTSTSAAASAAQNPTIEVNESLIDNSGNDGIGFLSTQGSGSQPPTYFGQMIVTKTRISDSGDDGIDVRWFGSNGLWTPSVHHTYRAYLTNNLITGYGDVGVIVFSTTGSANYTGAVFFYGMNNTFSSPTANWGMNTLSTRSLPAGDMSVENFAFNNILDATNGLSFWNFTTVNWEENHNDFNNPGTKLLINFAPAAIDATSFSADPQFTGTGAYPYELAYGSSCIGTGSSTNAPSEDIIGRIRPNDGSYDLGAYEFYASTNATSQFIPGYIDILKQRNTLWP